MARKVGTLGFALFASPAYLTRRGAPRRLAELARHELVGFPERSPAPSYLAWLRAYAPDECFVFRTASLLAQHEAARAGFGIVVGTRALLSADPRLKRVLPRAQVPSMDIWLAVHMDVRKNPAVARVLEHLTGVFSAARSTLP